MPTIHPDFSHVDGIVWDLDNTLYRFNEAVIHAFDFALARAAIEEGARLELATAVAMAEKSRLAHGYSGAVFVREHGVDDVRLHHAYHRYLDETILDRNAELATLFAATNLRHALLTHSSGAWARKALRHLGLDPWFDDAHIVALEDYGFEYKHAGPAGFARIVDRIGIEPERLLFVEDTQRNLAIPYDLGMTTVFIHHGRPASLPPYVHHAFASPLDLLRLFAV